MENKYVKLYWAYAIVKLCLFLAFLFAPLFAQSTFKHGGKWNILVYMAANNNLYRYGQVNIDEMKKVGSTQHANIFYQIDQFGRNAMSRYRVERGRAVHLGSITSGAAGISGTPESLFDFAQAIITKYPADRTALILWSHASGIKELQIPGWTCRDYMPFLRDACFIFNEKTQLYEIDTNAVSLPITRGFGFNEVARIYMSNNTLKKTLDRISKELLHGKKIDIVAFDACNQALVEVGTHVKEAADYMLASQELVPGWGWQYEQTLFPFKNAAITPDAFSRHVVNAYGNRYNHMFADLTFSATRLDKFDLLEKNIDATAKIMTQLFHENKKFLDLITKLRRSRAYTKSFVDADHIDLTTFYRSLSTMLKKNKNIFTSPAHKQLAAALGQTAVDGVTLLEYHIIQNTHGPRASGARGLSIYFPTRRFHPSYNNNAFSRSNSWAAMIATYLQKLQHKYGDLYREVDTAP